jgi:hypothetical protein
MIPKVAEVEKPVQQALVLFATHGLKIVAVAAVLRKLSPVFCLSAPAAAHASPKT